MTNIDPSGLTRRNLNNGEWKIVHAHLQALATCLAKTSRGRDPGKDLLVQHISKWANARDKYYFDPDYDQYAKTKAPYWFGYWTGLTFGTASKDPLTGPCKYSPDLASTIVHEFTHFDDSFWENGWAVTNGLYPYYSDADPETWHSMAGDIYGGKGWPAESTDPCFRKCLIEEVAKGCK
jgi:hypothetical protein